MCLCWCRNPTGESEAIGKDMTWRQCLSSTLSTPSKQWHLMFYVWERRLVNPHRMRLKWAHFSSFVIWAKQSRSKHHRCCCFFLVRNHHMSLSVFFNWRQPHHLRSNYPDSLWVTGTGSCCLFTLLQILLCSFYTRCYLYCQQVRNIWHWGLVW